MRNVQTTPAPTMARPKSEMLFEKFCNRAGIPFRRIAEERGPTPDYQLCFPGVEVIAEIKQIDPNDEDKTLRRQLDELGFAGFDHGEVGGRVRSKISKAANQLRNRLRPGQAAIVVIFNNVSVIRGFTDPINMMAAMHGDYEFVLSYFQGGEVAITDRRLGGKRKLTPKHNTTVSAICVIFEGPSGPYLVVYHNPFAANRLDPSILRQPGNVQFRLDTKEPGEFPKWVEI